MKTRKKRHGAGKLPPNNSEIIGAGNFGLVVSNSNKSKKVTKLFYDMVKCSVLPLEASIQIAARKALQGIALVPCIEHVYSYPIRFQDNDYLCGITMERVPMPEGFSTPVHMLLGYDQYDIDTEWGRDMKLPVGPNNPPRGFHAGPEMLTAIWEDEGCDLTLEKLAYIMGKGTSAMLDAGIYPFDIEWIYGGHGKIYVIDFGLAEFRTVDKNAYLHGNSSQSLAVNYYVPKPGMRGYTEFVEGFYSLGPRV